ncbi:MAG: chemotaxis protein CheW [Bryobacteraceae bacterium]|nr:chemotaxis protein CheW [Bryobacteraceae bacterium]
MAAAGATTAQRDLSPPLRRGRERFLIVRLAGKEFAIEAIRILAAMQMRTLRLQPLEWAPGWKHFVELQGRLAPVYCPNQAMGVPERPIGPRTCLVLIGSENGAQEPEFALQVDSVSRYEELSAARVRHQAGEGRSIRLGHKWRPVLPLKAIARYWAERGWSERSPTTS